MSDVLAPVLASFALDAVRGPVPADVREAARWHLVDTMGVCLAGASPDEDSGRFARDLVARWADERGTSVLGIEARCRPDRAALVNGALAQALEMDDKHGPSLARPGSTVVPAVLARGEELDSSVDDALSAIAVGYEAMIRLGLVAGDQFLDRGYHTSSLLGGFGAVIAVASLQGMSVPSTVDALGIVGTFASGIQESTRTGSTAKIVHGGWGAHAGLTAIDLAISGLTGPETVFEGDYGFFLTHLGSHDVTLDWNAAVANLGDRWHMVDTAFKPYPCCQLLHSFIDASLRLRAELAADGLAASDIEAVHGRLAEPGLRLVTEPMDRKVAPATPHEARFSLPFVVAHALVEGSVGVESFSEAALNDERVLGLASRVTSGEDPDSDYPQHNPADLRLTAGGKEYALRVEFHPGCPEAPFSQDDVVAKFGRNSTWLLGSEAAEVARWLARVDGEAPLASVLDLLRTNIASTTPAGAR